jgi:hypothetical protein
MISPGVDGYSILVLWSPLNQFQRLVSTLDSHPQPLVPPGNSTAVSRLDENPSAIRSIHRNQVMHCNRQLL